MPGKPDYPVQLVQPDGRRVLDREYADRIADIDSSGLWSLYEDLVVTRRIDIEATALQRQGQLALWAPILGQEAAQVGSARALREDDYVFGSYRETAVAYCRGVPLAGLTQMWRGVAHCGWDPATVQMANPAIVVGAQTLHATGYAYATMLDGAELATITYFGDGATSQGDTAEALTFAASWAAPVVFFCQNNHWAISEPVKVQSKTPLAARARGYGIPAVQVDGNDVLATLAVTRHALARARDGGGPTFIEALTYRMGPHTTADDPTKYREDAEMEEWRRRDPIDRVRRLLDREGFFDPAKQEAVTERANTIAHQFREATMNMPDPDPRRIHDHVYSAPHALIDAERADFLEYLSGDPEFATSAQTVKGVRS